MFLFIYMVFSRCVIHQKPRNKDVLLLASKQNNATFVFDILYAVERCCCNELTFPNIYFWCNQNRKSLGLYDTKTFLSCHWSFSETLEAKVAEWMAGWKPDRRHCQVDRPGKWWRDYNEIFWVKQIDHFTFSVF